MRYLFLPNGIGDFLMVVPALRHWISAVGLPNVTLILANKSQQEMAVDYFGEKLKTICRFDGGRFSQLRLLFKLMMLPRGSVYAPLASTKIINYMFFIMVFKKVFLPSNGVFKRFINLHFGKYNIHSFPGHQVNFYQNFLNGDDLEINNIPFSAVKLSQVKVFTGGKSICRIAVGLSCGANERHKIPNPEFIAHALNKLKPLLDFEVLIFGVTQDFQILSGFKQALDSNIKIIESLDIPVLALIKKIEACSVGLVGTTGQGHMMAAAGLPLVVLCGVTNPYESGPYVERAVVVSHSYACGPCYQEKFPRGCGLHPCMDSIKTQAIVSGLLKLIADPAVGLGWLDAAPKVPVKKVSEIKNILKKMDKF